MASLISMHTGHAHCPSVKLGYCGSRCPESTGYDPDCRAFDEETWTSLATFGFKVPVAASSSLVKSITVLLVMLVLLALEASCKATDPKPHVSSSRLLRSAA